MQTYAEYQPTPFDPRGLNADALDIRNWFVAPVIQTRDSRPLELSNFRSFLRALGGESNSVQVHRFGHWGPGWFEIIVINPADSAAVQAAEAMASALEDYPIVDESDFSELEWESAAEYWGGMSLSERVRTIQDANEHGGGRISVFAARRDGIPQEDNGRLFELLTRE